MSADLTTTILIVALASAIAGRLVDYSAVWFLFHPYKKINLPLIRELGVLPRRQEALADQVAKLIEDRLITKEAITEFLTSEEMAEKVRGTVRDALRRMVETEYPSIRDLLTRELGSAVDIDREINVFSDWAGERVGDLVGQAAFRNRLANFISEFLETRRDRPVDEFLPPGSFETITHYVEGRWDHLAGSAEKVALDFDTWAADLGLITAVLPQESVESGREYLKEHLPAWIRAADEFLEDEENWRSIKIYLFDVIDRLIKRNPNLLSWSIDIWKQVAPENFEHSVRSLIFRLREALEDPENVKFLQGRVDAFVDEILKTPLGTYYQRLGAKTRSELRGFLTYVLKSPNARRTISWSLGRLIDRARRSRLDDVLPAQVFQYDRVTRRAAEVATIAQDAICEVILPNLERVVSAERRAACVDAATANDHARLAELLAAEAVTLEGDDRREMALYCQILRGEPIDLAPGSDWVARGVDAACLGLADDPAQGILRNWVERGVEVVLGMPIGTPSRLLHPDRIRQVEDIAVNQILALLRNHAHKLAQAIDLKQMVRQRILAADPAAIEDVVKNRLAKREFNTIFAIGLLFGSVVGLTTTFMFHGVAAIGGWPAVLIVGVVAIAIMMKVVRV